MTKGRGKEREQRESEGRKETGRTQTKERPSEDNNPVKYCGKNSKIQKQGNGKGEKGQGN